MLFIWGEKCPRRSLSRNKRARGNVITRWPSHRRGTSIFPVNYVPFRLCAALELQQGSVSSAEIKRSGVAKWYHKYVGVWK
jgi:hypothetical protein